jgi:hypothetical protein
MLTYEGDEEEESSCSSDDGDDDAKDTTQPNFHTYVSGGGGGGGVRAVRRPLGESLVRDIDSALEMVEEAQVRALEA